MIKISEEYSATEKEAAEARHFGGFALSDWTFLKFMV